MVTINVVKSRMEIFRRLKFDLPVFARLAHDAIDFNYAFVVDEIEDRLLSDRLPDVLFAHIVVRLK